jgi:Family of unknown function (DUF6064)
MTLPFDARQFFEVFARYNTAVWPMQLVLWLAGLTTALAALGSRKHTDRAIGLVLGAMWVWMGAAYHLAFFSAINPAAPVFGVLFLLEGALLTVLSWRGQLRFHGGSGPQRAIGIALVGYALVLYPLLGYALGHRFPVLVTIGLPCPTTVLTLGLLGLTAPSSPWAVLVIPLLWSALGASAAAQFGMWEDFALPVAGGLVLWIVLRRARPIQPTRASTSPSGSGLPTANPCA